MKWLQTQRRKLLGWLQKRSRGEDKGVWSAFRSVVYAYGFYYGGWLLLILGGLAILSFTSWLGGPYVPAQVIFFLVAGTVAIILINLFIFWRALKGKWGTQDETQYREAKDVTDKRNDNDPVKEGRVIDSADDEQ